MKTRFKAVLVGAAMALCGTTFAAEGPTPHGVAHYDHIFLIMMENHSYDQVINNPNMPFFNHYAKSVNLATNYYAVGHPSLTNYLEIVGGSNFGVRNDNSPSWHDSSCMPNLNTGLPSLESDGTAICPITGTGMDAATPALDCTNEPSTPGNPATGVGCNIDVDGKAGYAAATTSGKTIADQLTERGMSWKAYEESLPPTGADGVNSADGLFSNLTLKSNGTTIPSSNFSIVTSNGTETGTVNGTVQGLYAVKHNPFAYFTSVQSGADKRNSLANTVGFDGSDGLFANLANNDLPNLVYIVPNQCHDQHGRGGATAGPECDYDTEDNGTLIGLNPALMYEGDVALERLVRAIHNSPAWERGNNAIVIVWDENDYSVNPTTNKVALLVDTSGHSRFGWRNPGMQSNAFYTSFSLLKTMEAGFGLPCLNHACDKNTAMMTDLFSR